MRAFNCALCTKPSRNFFDSSLVGGRRVCGKCSAGNSGDIRSGLRACDSNWREFSMGFGPKNLRRLLASGKIKTFADAEAYAKKKGFVIWSGDRMPVTERDRAKRADEREGKWKKGMLDDWTKFHRIEVS